MFSKKFFALRLKELRKNKGVSSSSLCQAIGQSNCYISAIETKEFIPPLPVFYRICEYLEISFDEFFNNSFCEKESTFALKKMIDLLSEKDVVLVENLVYRLLNQ